ncbi:Uncharacterised protein [uncultured archaeon]|nr:Uncharacterised protein [uncultured archaeon]
MKAHTILLCILFLFALAAPVLGDQHPGDKYCKYCHNKLGAPEEVRLAGQCSSACHISKPDAHSKQRVKPWYYRQRYSLHLQNSVCMKCHGKGTDDIHVVHKDFNVSCLFCHSAKGYTSEIVKVPSQNNQDSFVKPASKECRYCHQVNGSQLHDVHAARLEKACPTCHGGGVEPKRSNAGFGERVMAAGYVEEGIMPVRVVTELVDGLSSEIKEIIGLAFSMI